MSEWRLPAAIDAIVAALQGVGVQVWDGPIVSGDYSDAVYVGFDGEYGGEEKAATVKQDWASIGQRKRNEEDDIICAIVVQVGDGHSSWKPVRDAISALMETVGQALRSDTTLGPSLGLSGPSVAQLWGGELFQEQGPGGMQARLVFSINYKTRV